MTVLSDALAACARNTIDAAGSLKQRARLLDAVWADVQDERRSKLLQLVPRELLPRNSFGPACLTEYAVDLVCAPDGVWRVTRDRVDGHPGAAVLAMPLLAVFLPTLCRSLLGQSLWLASAPAWWLGDRETMPMLAARPHRFQLHHAMDEHRPPVALCNLSVAARQQLQAEVDRAPHLFVATLHLPKAATQTIRASAPLAMWD